MWHVHLWLQAMATVGFYFALLNRGSDGMVRRILSNQSASQSSHQHETASSSSTSRGDGNQPQVQVLPSHRHLWRDRRRCNRDRLLVAPSGEGAGESEQHDIYTLGLLLTISPQYTPSRLSADSRKCLQSYGRYPLIPQSLPSRTPLNLNLPPP